MPQMMNGHIWMESSGPGKGAVCKFIVMLKLDVEGDEGEKNEYEDDGPDVNFFALRVSNIARKKALHLTTCTLAATPVVPALA